MKEQTKLEPCPYCGGPAQALQRTCNHTDEYNPADRAFPVVRCTVCHAQACGKDWQDIETAVEAWNRRSRPVPTDVPAEVEASIYGFGDGDWGKWPSLMSLRAMTESQAVKANEEDVETGYSWHKITWPEIYRAIRSRHIRAERGGGGSEAARRGFRLHTLQRVQDFAGWRRWVAIYRLPSMRNEI